MCKGQLRMYFWIIQQHVQDLRFLDNIFIIPPGKPDLNIMDLQIHPGQNMADIQDDLQKDLFGFLKHQFGILGPGLCITPAITQDHRSTGIGCR